MFSLPASRSLLARPAARAAGIKAVYYKNLQARADQEVRVTASEYERNE
jgi:hypothetical protein